MKPEITRRIITVILLLALSSCSTSNIRSDQDKAFEEAIGQHYLDGLEINNFQSQNFDSYGVIQLVVNNKTAQCLSFSYDDSVRMFSYIDGRWFDIPNLVNNESSDDRLLLDPIGGLFPDTFIATKPDFSYFPDEQKPDNIRILVLANPCENPNSYGDVVGGHIDLNLSP
jgi:hypothetical protein